MSVHSQSLEFADVNTVIVKFIIYALAFTVSETFNHDKGIVDDSGRSNACKIF